MLRSIRSALSSFVVLLLLGLLIASFALWGIGDVFRTTAATAVAEVDDVEIGAVAFERALQQRLRQLEAQFGQPIDREQAAAFGIPQQVLQRLISETVFNLHARELGLRATDVQVVDAIREIPAFEGFDGRFDRQAYEMQLRSTGMTPAQFETMVRQELIRLQLVGGIAAAAPVPEPLAQALFRYRQEARRATILTVPAAGIEDVEQPTEEELRAVYETEPDRFMAPEYRKVAVARITPDALAQPDEVTQEDLEEAYEMRIEEFQSPELRDVEIVTFGAQEHDTANRFVQRVRAGEAFADMVAEMTEFAPTETGLGDVSRADLEADYNARIAEAVFAAPEGGLTDPVQSVFGWHVFSVKSVTPPVSRPLEQVAPALRQELARERALDRVYDLSVEAEDALARGAPLADIAREKELELVEATVSREGLTPQGQLAPEPAVRQVETIFTLQPGDPPALEETEDGGFALIEVREIVAPEKKPFEQVRDQILRGLMDERRMLAAGQRAEQAADQVRAGVPMAEIAGTVGGDVVQTGWIARQDIGQAAAVAPNVAQLMFQLQPGEVAIERAATGNGYVIARLEEVRPADPATTEAYAAMTEGLQDNLLGDLLVQYEQALRDAYGVEINQPLFDQIVRPQDQQQLTF